VIDPRYERRLSLPKKTATLPLLIASLKSKGRLMIAKMGKRKQDDGTYQLLYKQDDDAIFAKIYLSSEGNMKTMKQ
jgi:hypothetical protein